MAIKSGVILSLSKSEQGGFASTSLLYPNICRADARTCLFPVRFIDWLEILED